MPSAVTDPGPSDHSQVVVDSSHNGKEPQVAKIYQELQRRNECQAFTENMMKDKADYFLLLQHGGGKGNRCAISDRNGGGDCIRRLAASRKLGEGRVHCDQQELATARNHRGKLEAISSILFRRFAPLSQADVRPR
jgi:hypothetical protein